MAALQNTSTFFVPSNTRYVVFLKGTHIFDSKNGLVQFTVSRINGNSVSGI